MQIIYYSFPPNPGPEMSLIFQKSLYQNSFAFPFL